MFYNIIAYDYQGMEYFFPNLPTSLALSIFELLDELGLDVELKKVVSN